MNKIAHSNSNPYTFEVIVSTIYLCSNVILSILNLFMSPSQSREILFFLIIYGPFIVLVIKRNNVKYLYAFIPIILILITFGVTIVMHPEYTSVYNNVFFTRIIYINTGVSAYIFGKILYKNSDLINVLKITAFILFLYYFWRPIAFFKVSDWLVSEYSMDFGYQMLIPTLIFLFLLLKERKIYYLMLFVVGFIEVLLYGSRGALVSILFFIIIYYSLIVPRKYNLTIKSLRLIFLIFVGIILVIFNDNIILAINQLLMNIGLNSRTITSILENNLVNDIHRARLYSNSIELIASNPIIGYGPLADQFYMGLYVHNIFLEMILSFGLIGLVICVWFIVKLVAIFITSDNNHTKTLLLLLVSLGFIKLLVTSSFWYEIYFWVLIAFLTNTKSFHLKTN